jgi:glycine betaine/proline transport system permease protein
MKMFDFPEVIRLPVRDGVDAIMSWLLTNLDGLFDAIGLVILNVMLAFEAVFIFIPWFVMIPLVFFAGWKMMKSIRAGIVMALMLFLIGAFGYWEMAMLTLSLVSASVVFSLAIGIPLGISMAQSDRSESILKPILDGMQTMPSFVYLIPALMFFGLGRVPAVIATIIYAVPRSSDSPTSEFEPWTPRLWKRQWHSARKRSKFFGTSSCHWPSPPSWWESTRRR